MINSGYEPDVYAGNDVADTFAYNWKANDETHIVVTQVDDTTLVETVLVLNTDYTVTGVGEAAGGNVVLTDPLATGQSLIISRVVPITQETDFENQGGFFADTHEDAFDKLTQIVQEKSESLNRALKFSVASGLSGVELPAPEAGKVLVGKSDESGYENAALAYTSSDYPGTFSAGLDAAKDASPSAKDIYVATDTGIVYVCYSAGTWTILSAITVGLDASKTASPAAGQVYFATDTGKIYRCFSASTWTTAVTMANTLTMSGAAINQAKGSDIASASSIDLGAATGNTVDVTGTTTITALGTVQAGTVRRVRFTGILTLTYNATSLILPTGASITTAAGDTAEFISLGSGNWLCFNYQRASGASLLPFTPTALNALAGSVVQVVETEVTSVVTCGTTGTTYDDS